MQCQNVHYIMYIMSTSMHYCRCILQKLCDIKWMFYQKHLWQTYEWLCCSVIVINIMFRNISDICFSVFFFLFFREVWWGVGFTPSLQRLHQLLRVGSWFWCWLCKTQQESRWGWTLQMCFELNSCVLHCTYCILQDR